MDYSDICSLCSKSCQQILILSCIHNLCINCAVTLYEKHLDGRQQNPIFICQTCLTKTKLDPSTITLLSSLVKLNNKVLNQCKSNCQKTSSPGQLKIKKKSQLTPTKIHPNSQKKNIISQCQYHHNQEFTSYCFDCLINICHQCVTHGQHRNHKVKPTNQALNQIKQNWWYLINFISQSQNLMTHYRNTYINLLKDITDKYKKDKTLFINYFESFHLALTNKEKQLLKNLEDINRQNFQMLSQLSQTINIYYQQLNQINKQIECLLTKNQFSILHEFNSSKFDQMEQKIRFIKMKNEQLSRQIKVVDLEAWISGNQNSNQISGFQKFWKKEDVKRVQIGLNTT